MIYNRDINKPYILISEDGVRYVMDLLIARRSVYNDILYSDENNWINGVVNQITAQTMKFLPHLEIMLPFITDQILMQFYTNELFLGTQIEKLNKLFHGKIDCSGYGKPMRYKLKDKKTLTNEQLKDMYKAIKKINDEHNRIDTIAVVFYTNIKGKDEEEENVKEKVWDDILIYKKKFYEHDSLQNGKYHPFKELAEQKSKEITPCERFPNRPSELAVKNLFYFWINNFVLSENDKHQITDTAKNELIKEIKIKIGAICSNGEKIDGFKKTFVALDEIKEVNK